MDTYYLVEKDIAEGGAGFDPYKLLHIDNDAAFDTKEIKQAYGRLSLKYHPDKVDFAKVPEEQARRRFKRLVTAYKTLTNKEMYDNWIRFGNPDGSVAIQAVGLAMPAWLLDPEWRPFLLTSIFLGTAITILSIIALFK